MANASSKNSFRGRAAEFLVAFDFSFKGYSAIVNSDAASPYDLLIDVGRGKILKVQVKSTSKPYKRNRQDTSKAYRFQLTGPDKKRYCHIDLYAFVALDTQSVWYVSKADVCVGRSKSTTIDFNVKRFTRLASGSLERILRRV